MRGIRIGIVAGLVGAALAVAGFAAPAFASDSGDIYGGTNSYRAANGLGALKANGSLAAVAQNWANHMAATQSMVHNPNVTQQVPGGWQAVGENIAEGFASGAATMQGWINSPPHRANLLGNYTDLGVGWTVDSKGVTWAVQVFARYATAAAAPAPAPAPVAKAAPAPAPAPAAAAPKVTVVTRAPAATTATAAQAAPVTAAPAAAPVAAAIPTAGAPDAVRAAAALAESGKPEVKIVLHGDPRLAAKRTSATTSTGGTASSSAAFVASLVVMIGLLGGAIVQRIRRREVR